MSIPQSINIVEVGPRDGLQNEASILSANSRVNLIQALGKCGLRNIEVGSFVSTKRLPQMARTEAVLQMLDFNTDIRYPVLIPNLTGLQNAIDAGATEISVFTAASETFNYKNINCNTAESMLRYKAVIDGANARNISVRAYISCVLGCPYEGKVSMKTVRDLAFQFMSLGCYEVSLGDTIGVGTPLNARNLVQKVANEIGADHIALHFHDTYGQALANIINCLDLGVTSIDSSVAGLGGCPFAKGASGNVASEDVVYMLENMGVKTGVDLDQLVKVGQNICAELNIPVRSKVNLAWNKP